MQNAIDDIIAGKSTSAIDGLIEDMMGAFQEDTATLERIQRAVQTKVMADIDELMAFHLWDLIPGRDVYVTGKQILGKKV